MLVLTADQKVTLTASFEDDYGNKAPVDGLPRWEAGTEGIVTITPAVDGMSAEVVTVGRVGTVQVRCSADSQLGTGETMIIGLQDIEVVGGEARVVRLMADAATSKEDEGEEEPDVPDESVPDEPAHPVPSEPDQPA